MPLTPQRDVITARQLTHTALFSAISLLAGVAPAVAAGAAGSAGWLAPLFGLPPVIGMAFLLQYMYRKRPDDPLDQIFYAVWGRIPGRAVLALYAAWCTLQASFSLRLYIERIQAGMFTRTGGALFAMMLLAICWWASIGRLNALTRASAVFFGLVALTLLVMLLLALPDYNLGNLLPVNPMRAQSIVLGGASVLGPFGVLIYANFLSGRVENRHLLGRHSLPALAVITLGCMLLFAFTIGILGAPLTARMQDPFLIAVKNISGTAGNARLEAFVIALWTMPTFVFISLMSMVALTLFASIGGTSGAKPMAGPLQLFIYVGALSLGVYAADVVRMYTSYVQVGHYVFQYGIPVLTLGLGKLRRKI